MCIVSESGGPQLRSVKNDPSTQFIAACLPAQIKVNIEQTTRVAAWSAVQDRLLLVQRWQGTKIAELNLPNKTANACAHRWKRFHAKVLDTTMVNLPEHASSDFVAELSDLMSDHAWWDAVEEKRVELLNDRAGAPPSPPPTLSMAAQQLQIHPLTPNLSRPRSIGSCRRRSSTDGRRSARYPPHSLLPPLPAFTPTLPLITGKPAPCTARSERNEIKAIGEHHSELLVLAARLLRVRRMQFEQRLLTAAAPHTPPPHSSLPHHTHHPRHIASTPVKLPPQPCMCRPPHRQCARACRPATTSRARRKHLPTARSQRRYAPM